MDLIDRHILVTGAAKRIGRHLAEGFLKRGARISAHYHSSLDEIEALVRLGEQRGLKVVPIHADLRKTNSIQEAVRLATSRLGPVDILVNSAGSFYPTPSLQCTVEQWDDMTHTNLRGQFFFATAAAASMAGRGGVILNIADVHASKPIKNYTPYAISKAGVVMMTRNFAKEWAPHIRVNSISPGPVLLPESYTPAQRETSANRTLLKRLGSPEDIFQAALFLIQSDYITGFDLAVDGGRSLV